MENRDVCDQMKENARQLRNYQGWDEPWMSKDAKLEHVKLMDKLTKGKFKWKEQMVKHQIDL